jgi:hypothetical protein
MITIATQETFRKRKITTAAGMNHRLWRSMPRE